MSKNSFLTKIPLRVYFDSYRYYSNRLEDNHPIVCYNKSSKKFYFYTKRTFPKKYRDNIVANDAFFFYNVLVVNDLCNRAIHCITDLCRVKTPLNNTFAELPDKALSFFKIDYLLQGLSFDSVIAVSNKMLNETDHCLLLEHDYLKHLVKRLNKVLRRGIDFDKDSQNSYFSRYDMDSCEFKRSKTSKSYLRVYSTKLDSETEKVDEEQKSDATTISAQYYKSQYITEKERLRMYGLLATFLNIEIQVIGVTPFVIDFHYKGCKQPLYEFLNSLKSAYIKLSPDIQKIEKVIDKTKHNY